MYFRVFLLFTFLSVSFTGFSQKKDEFKKPRVLILLDGSSSMVNDWGSGKTRFQAAGDIVLRLMDSIYQVNSEVEFSLRVYGHGSGVPENNCYDTRREVMFSRNNLTQMALRLSSLRPLGVSPIAYSLKVAAETDFVQERDYTYSLILITDGGESCGGDICDVVRNLLDKKIHFKPYIVSLVDYEPLKDQYSCLGNYLMVSKPAEVPAAINTIAGTYRRVLAVPVAKPRLTETSRIPSPSVQKISVPTVRLPAKEAETTRVVHTPVQKPSTTTPTPPEPEPKAPSSSKIRVDTAPYPKEQFARLRRYGFERVHYDLYWTLDRLKRKQVPPLRLPPPEPASPSASAPATRPAPAAATPRPRPQQTVMKPVSPAKHEPKLANFTVQLEPAPETSLEIYFTDGKGKFYTTTPPMQLIDARTGAEVKKFYRTVDASGKPDPQQVQPGSYILVMGKTGNYRTKAITVEAANRNKITVVVTKGSLIFRYDDNPKRPVKEFTASVRKTFESRTNVWQKCTEELEYEPGNYHIEINTLPMMVRNIDLDFGWSYTIDIPEPGYLQFTNTNNVGKVSLWAPLGDQFLRFHTTEVKGDPAAQTVRLQPGVYEVHWKRNPGHPNEPDVVQKFQVKSNHTTELELE